MASHMLKLQNITKRFPDVLALDNVNININININKGEIHGLCGENGAGKSTLIKILSGVYPYGTYEGDIIINGEEHRSQNMRDAEEIGMICIHQELALFPELSIAENIFMVDSLQKMELIGINCMRMQRNILITLK